MIMSRVGGLAVGLTLVLAARAFAVAPENPRGMMIAGQSIIAVDEARSHWSRGLGAQDSWSKIVLLGEAKDALSFGMTCAQDGSGKCILAVIRDGRVINVLYDAASGSQEILPLDDVETALFPNKNELYYTKPRPDGGRDLFLYNVESRTSALAGAIASTEIVTYLKVDGVLRPIALKMSGTARALGVGLESTPVDMPYSDRAVAMDGLMYLPEGWGNDKPIIPGRQSLSVVWLETTGAGSAPIGAKGSVAVSAALNGAVFVPGSVRVDAGKDIVAQLTGPQGRHLGLVCNVDNGRGFGTFARMGVDSIAAVWSSASGPGFIIKTGDMMTTGSYRYVSFPAPGGYESRKCADVKLSAVDLAIAPRSVAAEFEKTVGTATSADGTKLPYIVFRRKGEAPRRLIIHGYGAYGAMVGQDPYPDYVLNALKQHGTAVVLPILRGDGNLGYDRAVASRPPNRHKAVEDLLAVAQKLAVDFPGIKPVVRGGSAGGWLAVRSALERPDLFAGVISISGAYTVSGLTAVSGGNERFFTPQEDLALQAERLKTACPGLKFRFLHARDDWRLPYADAVEFADLVKTAGCPVEFVTFDTGGHEIDIPIDKVDEGMRRTRALYDPFTP